MSDRQSLSIVLFGSGMYTIPIIEVLKRHGLQLVITTEKETEQGEKLYKSHKNEKGEDEFEEVKI